MENAIGARGALGVVFTMANMDPVRLVATK